MRSKYLIRLLRYGDRENSSFEMNDREREIFTKLYSDGHCVEIYQGFFVGDRVVITDGPLIGFESYIKRIDRHKMVTHHIVNDGISSEILWHDLSGLYSGNALSEQKIQYKDFAAWQNELLWSDYGKKQEGYWLNAFSGELPTLNLPVNYSRPIVQSFEGDNINFKIEKARRRR